MWAASLSVMMVTESRGTTASYAGNSEFSMQSSDTALGGVARK